MVNATTGTSLFILIVSLLLIGIDRRSPTEKIITSYINNPLHDVSIKVPVYIHSQDLNFPDIHSASSIYFAGFLADNPTVVSWHPDFQIGTRNDTNLDAEYLLDLFVATEDGLWVEEDERCASVFFRLISVSNNDIPFYVSQTLSHHMFGEELKLLSKENDLKGNDLALQDTSDLHVEFTLLRAQDDSFVHLSLEEAMNPLLNRFKKEFGFNFAFSFEEKTYGASDLEETKTVFHPAGDPERRGEMILRSDLQRWDDDKAKKLHLVLFVSPGHNQDFYKVISSTMYENAFLIPGWGSMVEWEEPLPSQESLNQTAEKLMEQLFIFLDIPSLPYSYPVRADITKRVQTVRNLKELASPLSEIHGSAQQESTMFYRCLQVRKECVSSLREGRWNEAYQRSVEALEIAERLLI